MPIASETSPPLSTWRYVVVLMTMLAALWMYVDRVCFSILADPIRGTLGIDAQPMSYVLGAFFFAYAICQVPAGAVADRYGPRMALALCVAGWSAATALTSFVGSLYGLLAARLLLGVAEAGAYPAAGGLIANWASPKERGSFSGIVSLGGRLGGASAPYLTGALAVALLAWSPETAKSEGNWRAVFFIFGTSGILVAVLVWLLVRDRPPLPPMVTETPVVVEKVAENTGIQAPAPLTERTPAGPGPDTHALEGPTERPVVTRVPVLLLILGSGNLWLCSATQFGVNIGWAFLVTLMPSFLSNVYHVSLQERGEMQSIPLLVGCVGMLGGGFFTDFLRGPLGRRWCRAAPIGAALLIASVAFLVIPYLTSAWAVVGAFACVALLVDLGVPAIWAFNQDVGGRNVGKVFGWGNMWGNLGAALSPVLLNRVSEASGWPAVFMTCAAAFAVAGVCGLCMNATRPLEPPVVPMPLPPE